MRMSTQLAGFAAVATLAVTSGTALTDANTVAPSVAGYGSAAVSGATATAVVHTLNGTGDKIVSTEITFDADQTGRTVVAGFDSTALEGCVVTTVTATCTYALTGYDTATAFQFHVAVS